MLQRGIGETFPQAGCEFRTIDDRVQRPADLAPIGVDEIAHGLFTPGIGHRRKAGNLADGGYGAVGTVQHSELHMLIRFDIADKFHARFLERRPSMRKAVFDDETEIGFGNDRPRITQAECDRNRIPVRIRGGGYDPVHHRAGAGDIGFDEGGQLRIGQFRKFQQQLLQHMAVGGQVVAGQQRQGPRTLFAPAPRGRKDEAEDGTWPVRVFEIMDDIRVFAQQLREARLVR